MFAIFLIYGIFLEMKGHCDRRLCLNQYFRSFISTRVKQEEWIHFETHILFKGSFYFRLTTLVEESLITSNFRPTLDNKKSWRKIAHIFKT